MGPLLVYIDYMICIAPSEMFLRSTLVYLVIFGAAFARNVHGGANSTSVTNPDVINETPCQFDCEQDESLSVMLMVLLLLLCIFIIYWLLMSKFRFIPESSVHIFLGMLAGMVIRWSGGHVSNLVLFDSEGFFLFLLPPIIFESGYSLHKGNFFDSIGSISAFAFIGTFISTMIVGTCLFLVGQWGMSYPLPALECFLFGALISSVDPVVTLAVFRALKVDPRLNMLVFGESVLNDAVAIVLFRTFFLFMDQDLTAHLAFKAIGQFFLICVGSVCIGIVFGLLSALLFKHTRLHDFPTVEISVVFLMAYLPYLLAEATSLSGIMAVLFNGIVMAHYTHFNLSPACQVTADHMFKMIAFLAEMMVFLYLGLAVFTFRHHYQVMLICWAIVLIIMARAANIFPLSKMVNSYRTVKISNKDQFIMWFSGLRGAIAFALSLNVPGDHRAVIITTTLMTVLFSIIVFGSGTWPLLKVLRQSAGRNVPQMDLRKTAAIRDQRVADDLFQGSWDHATGTAANVVGRFEQWDRNVLSPTFVDSDRAQMSIQADYQQLLPTHHPAPPVVASDGGTDDGEDAVNGGSVEDPHSGPLVQVEEDNGHISADDGMGVSAS